MKNRNLVQTSTIYVELEVTAVLHNQQEVHMQGDINLRFDGKTPYEEDDIIEYDTLLESVKADGCYMIFSCSCGIPECAGRYNGIKVSHFDNKIEWIDLDTDKRWIFDKNSLINQLNTVRKEARDYKAFFKRKEIDYVGIGYTDQS